MNSVFGRLSGWKRLLTLGLRQVASLEVFQRPIEADHFGIKLFARYGQPPLGEMFGRDFQGLGDPVHCLHRGTELSGDELGDHVRTAPTSSTGPSCKLPLAHRLIPTALDQEFMKSQMEGQIGQRKPEPNRYWEHKQ